MHRSRSPWTVAVVTLLSALLFASAASAAPTHRTKPGSDRETFIVFDGLTMTATVRRGDALMLAWRRARFEPILRLKRLDLGKALSLSARSQKLK